MHRLRADSISCKAQLCDKILEGFPSTIPFPGILSRQDIVQERVEPLNFRMTVFHDSVESLSRSSADCL